jgi:tetratricopeptide (TPR) repeat protein
LQLGIAAYENTNYGNAIDHLERAVTLDPKSLIGHLYLADAYENTYSEECDWDCDTNEHRRVRAIEEYRKVLELDPSNTEALKALAWRYDRDAKFDEAERYYQKILDVDPNDFEALYSLAVLKFNRSYILRAEKRAELKLERKKPLINSSSCTEIRLQNLARVQESMSLLKRATEIAESYAVKEYMSLLYQERADIQCGDRSAYDQDVSAALMWARRACDARHKPDLVTISCKSLRCPPPTPPPPAPGQPGACSD